MALRFVLASPFSAHGSLIVPTAGTTMIEQMHADEQNGNYNPYLVLC